MGNWLSTRCPSSQRRFSTVEQSVGKSTLRVVTPIIRIPWSLGLEVNLGGCGSGQKRRAMVDSIATAAKVSAEACEKMSPEKILRPRFTPTTTRVTGCADSRVTAVLFKPIANQTDLRCPVQKSGDFSYDSSVGHSRALFATLVFLATEWWHDVALGATPRSRLCVNVPSVLSGFHRRQRRR